MREQIKISFDLSDEELNDIFERSNYEYEKIMIELKKRSSVNNSETEDSNEPEVEVENSEADEDIIEESETEEEENEEDESFSEEMESEAFPEINNKGYTFSVDLSNGPDYSNYIPPEEDDEESDNDSEDEDYSDYDPVDRKTSKRDNKKQQQIRTKKYNAEDMSEY